MEKREHRYSQFFPRMTEEAFAELRDSIKENGQRDAVVMLDDAILDGRHRYRACEELGVDCRTRMFGSEPSDGTNALLFVLDKNLHHRHLTAGQRAALALEIKPELEQLARERQGQRTDLHKPPEAKDDQGNISQKIDESNERPDSNERRAAAQAAKVTGANRQYVADVEKIKAEDEGLFEAVKAGKTNVAAAKEALKTKQSAEAPRKQETYILLDQWKNLSPEEQTVALDGLPGGSMNSQNNMNIEWAMWSWNPVSGCRHNCPYCYARDIADRFYSQKFEPTWYPDRINAPATVHVPHKAEHNIGFKNIFVCSMADLFGKWVPKEWILRVLQICQENPQWNFLFLTKFPIRLSEFTFPDNAWVGTSVDCQARVANVEKAFAKVEAQVKWLSCEPLLEPLKFERLDLFQWVVIGGASKSTKTPEWQPPREWIVDLEHQANLAGCFLYEKDNMRIREYPGMHKQSKTTPQDFHYPLLTEQISE
jgi:protein gp37/ParB-like chromosome segregation protein Spo0J